MKILSYKLPIKAIKMLKGNIWPLCFDFFHLYNSCTVSHGFQIADFQLVNEGGTNYTYNHIIAMVHQFEIV